MARSKAKAKTDALVERMNDFATTLLEQAQAGEVGMAAKMDIFAKIAAWIGVRNRIEDGNDGGGDLDGYRSRLKTAGADHRRANGQLVGYQDFDSSARGGRRGMATRLGRERLDDEGGDGTGIAALKSRIPLGDDAGDSLDLGDDAGGAGAVAAGAAGSIRPGDDDGGRADDQPAGRQRDL